MLFRSYSTTAARPTQLLQLVLLNCCSKAYLTLQQGLLNCCCNFQQGLLNCCSKTYPSAALRPTQLLQLGLLNCCSCSVLGEALDRSSEPACREVLSLFKLFSFSFSFVVIFVSSYLYYLHTRTLLPKLH